MTSQLETEAREPVAPATQLLPRSTAVLVVIMSLFGTSPPKAEEPSMSDSFARSRHSLFDDDDPNQSSNSLFADADDPSRTSSPWDMPTPRKQQTRAELLRNLLPVADVPDSYIEAFDAVLRAQHQEESSSDDAPNCSATSSPSPTSPEIGRAHV